MTGGEKLRATDIHQHEIERLRSARHERRAVRLDAEAAFEMGKRGGGVGEAGFGDEGSWVAPEVGVTPAYPPGRNPELAGMPKSGNIRPC